MIGVTLWEEIQTLLVQNIKNIQKLIYIQLHKTVVVVEYLNQHYQLHHQLNILEIKIFK